jgi:PIN domain nuclease of toxin-antitoxin system
VAVNLSDSSNTVYFSSASIWEIAIKRSLNRANFDFSPEDIHRLALRTGFTELMVKGEDCYPLVNLPWHHRDPFDRLLIAQAQSLPAYLLTTDGVLRQYSELVIHMTLEP